MVARPAKRSQTKTVLPSAFAAWFSARGWSVRPHQQALIEQHRDGRSTLLIAPTGAGKTLAGFLPSLLELAAPCAGSDPLGRTPYPAIAPTPHRGLHTLYISPLKALAVDVQRNLMTPVSEMGLSIRIETRTGDTPASRRARQRVKPPDILLTTPEQLALMLSHDESPVLFSGLRRIVLDELHALVTSKRGDLLALGLARLRTLAPDVVLTGLSATVARPSELRAYLAPQRNPDTVRDLADLVTLKAGAEPLIGILETDQRIPWSGHSSRYAMPDVYEVIKANRLTLIFVNTRSQAELTFQELWLLNDDNLPIALHHGSLDVERRRKVEAAMARGALKAVVATSTLDLGIDWGDVDMVIHIGAPKGSSRLAQRIGRANHRLDEPSRAILVPSNRFEVMECQAALEAAAAGAQDTPPLRTGGLDVLAQHVFGCAVSGPFARDTLFREIRSAAPYSGLTRHDFEQVVEFVAHGGYALKTYERYAKLKEMPDGRMRLAHPMFAQQYRLNIGTIIEEPMLKVRLIRRRQSGDRRAMNGGRVLGEIEEYFVDQLAPGDTFVFAGEVVRFEGIRETDAYVSKTSDPDAKVPAYAGGKFPLSTYLAERVRAMLADRRGWKRLPVPVSDWLKVQARKSVIPKADEVLVEVFPRQGKTYLVVYPFEGRLAHQTLGMLLTRRLDRAKARPMGFTASEYALTIWCLADVAGMIDDGRIVLADLFAEDMLGDDLDEWLATSSLLKRTFRANAIISGLIERRHPGKEKSGRQMTVSSDLIYDVLRQHEPDHILLKATWADAATGLLDIARLGEFLKRAQGKLIYRALPQVSPLAVPVLLEIGKERVYGEDRDQFLREAADELIREAMDQ